MRNADHVVAHLNFPGGAFRAESDDCERGADFANICASVLVHCGDRG
jgi:hypothetical protein